MNFFQKALKRSQNDENVILPITFYAFLALFSKFLKIFHKIWKNLIFLPQISYFMTNHPKQHNKVFKFWTLYNPLCPGKPLPLFFDFTHFEKWQAVMNVLERKFKFKNLYLCEGSSYYKFCSVKILPNIWLKIKILQRIKRSIYRGEGIVNPTIRGLWNWHRLKNL